MNLEGLLATLQQTGLSIVVSLDGQAKLQGKKENVSDDIRKALAEHREAIIARFRPQAQRRIVLVDESGEVEKVLEECGKAGIHERTRNHADKHPGEVVAAEWLGSLGWVRYLAIDRRSVLANGSSPASTGEPEGNSPGDAAQSLPASGNRDSTVAPDSAA